MISFARPEQITGHPYFAASIESDLRTDAEQECWVITGETGSLGGLLTRSGSFCRLLLENTALQGEVLEFLDFLGWQDVESNLPLPLENEQKQSVLLAVSPLSLPTLDTDRISCHTQGEEGHSCWKFAQFQQQCGTIDEESVPAYCTVLSRKIRRGCAESFLLERDGFPIAAANLSAIGSQTAVLSGVAVLPTFRGQGLGRQMASAAASRAAALGKQAVLCCRPALESFYASLGFQLIPSLYHYHRF